MLLVIRTSYGDSFLTMIKVVLACYNVPNQLKGFCCFITARLDISSIFLCIQLFSTIETDLLNCRCKADYLHIYIYHI